jgi:CRP-like cAMP-binding protein
MGERLELEAGEVIFVEGEPGEFLYIIQEGEVLLLKEEGKRVSPLTKVEAVGFVGELSAFANRGVRNLSAVTTKKTSVYKIAGSDIKKVLKTCTDWVPEIMQILSDRLKASTEVMKEHRITSDEMENYAQTHTKELMQYQEQIKSYRQKNGLIL